MKQLADKELYYHYTFEEILYDIVCELRENVPGFVDDDVYVGEQLEYDREKDYIKGYSEMSYRFTEDKYELVKNAFMESKERKDDVTQACHASIIGFDNSRKDDDVSKYFKKYDDGYEFYFGLEVHKGDKDRMLREKISDVERAVPTDPMEAYRQERLEERKYGRRHY